MTIIVLVNYILIVISILKSVYYILLEVVLQNRMKLFDALLKP